jgi:tail tube protein
MATQAKIGYGTVFQTDYTLASPTVWVTMSEVNAVALPPLSRDAIDASHECAPDEWRTFVTGLNSGGEITVAMNFVAAQYVTLQNEFATKTTKPRRILFQNGAYVIFNATLTSLDAPVTVSDKIVTTAKFKIDGEPGLFVP